MENLQNKLFEAAMQGSINSLHQLLNDDPLILDRVAINCFDENPLHVAAMLGHLDFVKEIICLKPKLLDEVNSQKSTTLHMAAAGGHVEVVRALLFANRGACLALDKNKLTPLHLAAGKGRVEVMKLLLEAEPDAAYRGESILHLCVKHNQLEALEVVVKGLGDEGFINSTDEHGNTVLHLAVADKQVETVKFLMSAAIEANATNEEGMTAIDVLIRSKRDVRDSEIENFLKHGGTPFGDLETVPNDNNTIIQSSKERKNSLKSSLKHHENWSEKTKNELMVVASVIATMCFQIGVNPPGGVWQDDNYIYNAIGESVNLVGSPTSQPVIPHRAGYAVLASNNPVGYEDL